MNKRIFATLFSLICIIAGTYLAIRYAQGYRPTTTGNIRATGLLAANSFPNGASVYINGNLTSATDTTLNLEPGDYDIEIRKDGYTSWNKRIHIEKELVVQTNAVLFPIAASLTPLTFTGAMNLTPSPDGQQLLYTTASASAVKSNGIYVLSLTDSPIALQRGAFQIARSTPGIDLATAKFVWSPDSSQILLTTANRALLLATNRLNDLDTLADVSIRKLQILSEWESEFDQKRNAALKLFPEEILSFATQSAKNVFVSPDQERLVYTATASGTLIELPITAVPAANTQAQTRELVPGGIYVYDRHEDRNFQIGEEVTPPTPVPSPTPTGKKNLVQTPKSVAVSPDQFALSLDELKSKTSALFTRAPQWLADSKHLIFTTDSGIDVVEYDGTNRVKVYAGPFAENFVYPWPNGSKLIILTNFNAPDSGLFNLYAVGIK